MESERNAMWNYLLILSNVHVCGYIGRRILGRCDLLPLATVRTNSITCDAIKEKLTPDKETGRERMLTKNLILVLYYYFLFYYRTSAVVESGLYDYWEEFYHISSTECLKKPKIIRVTTVFSLKNISVTAYSSSSYI